MPNVNFKAVLESNLPSNGSATTGCLYFTDTGKLKLGNSSGNLLNIASLQVVDSLPSTPITEIGYILTTDNSVNYYTTQWNKISTTNQILVQNTTPTDTNKLWLDNTDLTMPRLKYYNGTDWVSGNIIINDSAILGNITEVFSANKVLELTNALRSITGDITGLNTTNKSSLTVACNEILDKINQSNTASNVSYNNTTSGISATNVQACLDFLYNTSASNKASLAGVMGSPSTINETFTQLISDITSQKIVLANTLTNKGIDSVSSETVNSLVSKVNQLTITSNPKQIELNVTAPYTYTFNFTNPVNVKNLCQTLILYTNGSIVSRYNCGFDSSDSSNFTLGNNISLNGIMDLATKTQTDVFTKGNTLGSGTRWTSATIDTTTFNTIDKLTYTDSDTSPTLKVDGTNSPSLTVQNSDINLENIKNINSIVWTTNTSGSGISKLIMSFDSGTTWKAYNGTSWITINISDLSDIKTNGMNGTTVNSLTSTILETERNNSTTLRFAYYLEKGNYSDTANNDSIIVNINTVGTYSICPSSYYTISLASDGSVLTYNFTTSGSYVLNVVDNL